MEERSRSGSHSGGGGGGVVKSRSSSGCLIIKKKPDSGGGGGAGGSSIGGRKPERLKEKKRQRLTTGSESVSSEEELLEYYRRRGGVSVSGADQVSSGGPVVYKRGVGNHGGEFSSKVSDFDGMGFGRDLDVYDFDEYDDLSDVERVGGMRHFYGRENRFLSSRAGVATARGIEFESGSSKGDIIYKRRNSFNGGMDGGRIRGGDRRSVRRRFEVGDDVGNERFSGGGTSEAIRLQGKNGVLKVMVKHKKDNVVQMKRQNYRQVEGNSLVHRPHEMVSKNVVVRHSPYSDRRLQKKPMAVGRVEEDQQKKRKSLSVKSSEESDDDDDSEEDDTPAKMRSDSVEAHRPVKRGKSEGSVRSPETPQPPKLKEGKGRRGSGTEKQLLREKIRNMLVSAGWTIDYRPRRGRDYSDAVYVNPVGTAYWSIIKAYDALQKQLEEEGNSPRPGDDCSSFAPISENVLSKLTRQTRQKIEKELKRKKKEEGGGKRKKFTSRNYEEDESDTDSKGSGRHDEKLSSFMKRSGKSSKGASKDAYSRYGRAANHKMHERGDKSSSMSDSGFIHGRKSKKIGRCTLLIRRSEKGPDSDNDGFVPYTGKRNWLSWLIDSGIVKLGEKVHYMNRRRSRIMLEGWITADGIHCGCCSKILTISKFEIHAGSKLRQPFQNTYASSGISLLQCQVNAWNSQNESQRNGFHRIDVDGDDPNDDTCAICGDGGNLICCDGCPSTFHQNCLDIRILPPGDWHCPHCSCKFCGLADVGMTDGNETRMDTLITCSLCEGKFHSSCMEEMDDVPFSAKDPISFCGKKCQELFEHLQKLLGVKHDLEGGLCWSLIHRTDLGSDPSDGGYPQRVEWNTKLAVASAVMDECFLPITDRRSGINMIHNVLYNCGSNLTRLNYSGFYTAILERGDEIVAAACIRIRGTQFAEMPFIGTRHIYRRQGMCRQLFSAIEMALRSLNVEKLIIPAISELMDTWTSIFGFSALGDSDKQELKTLNMLAFPGTDMLQKKLLDQDSMTRNLGGSLEAVPDSTDKPDLDASPTSNTDRMNDKSVAGLCSQDAITPFQDTSSDSTCRAACNEVKPYPHTASANVSKEVKPLTEGNQGTVSSALQLDTNSNDSTGDVKVHNSPDSSSDIHQVRNSLNGPTSKHDKEASAPEASPRSTPGDVCNQVESSLRSASVDFSNEVKPLVCEGSQGTISSMLQVDTKFNGSYSGVKMHTSPDASADIHEIGKSSNESTASEHDNKASAVEASPHRTPGDVSNEVEPSLLSASAHSLNEVKTLVCEGSEGTISSTLLNESADDVKMQTSPDATADIHETGKSSNDSASKHDKDSSLECKMTQEPSEADVETALPPADNSIPGTSHALSNGFAVNDENGLTDGVLFSKHGSAAGRKHHSLPEASHDCVVVGQPIIASPADASIPHSTEVEVDDAHEVPAKVVDCSSPQKTEPSTTSADVMHGSRLSVCHGVVEVEKPQPEASHDDIVGNPMEACPADASIPHSTLVEVDDTHEVPAKAVDYFSPQKAESLTTLADEMHGSPLSASHGAIEVEKPQPEASHDDVVVGNPMAASPADASVPQSTEVEVDDTHEVPAETVDYSSPQKTDPLPALADKMHVSPLSVSLDAVEVEKPQPQASHDDDVLENPMATSPADASIPHSTGVEVYDTHEVPAKEVDNPSPQKTETLTALADELHGAPLSASHDAVQVDKPQPEASHDDVLVGNPMAASPSDASIPHSTEVEVDYTHEVPAEAVDCSSLQKTEPLTSPAGEMHGSPLAVEVEKPQPDSCNGGGTSNQQLMEGDAHEFGFRVSSIQLDCSFSCEITAQVDVTAQNAGNNEAILEDKASHEHNVTAEVDGFQSLGSTTCEVSAQNVVPVGVEKPKFDALEAVMEVATGQSADIVSENPAESDRSIIPEKHTPDPLRGNLEGEVNHAHDISVDVADAQPICTSEASLHRSENPPSPSKLDDQGTV